MLIFDPNFISDQYIQEYTNLYLQEYAALIKGACYKLHKDSSVLTLSAFRADVHEELQKACYSFINQGYDLNKINAYLFSSLRGYIKSLKEKLGQKVLVCPACLFNGKQTELSLSEKMLVCDVCSYALSQAITEWEKTLYEAFSIHKKNGFRCSDCKYFIPDDLSEQLICPYPECIFVGDKKSLTRMEHPYISKTIELSSQNDGIESYDPSTYNIVASNINNYISVINECISSQINTLPYKGFNKTYFIRSNIYEAFKIMLDKYPDDMIAYLVFGNKNIGAQHRIFQTFTSILESKLPFLLDKGETQYQITSLLDSQLSIFDGVSSFDSIVNDKLEIDNATQELYVGGRKGTYCKPFYLGKVVEIKDIERNISMMDKMQEHTFFTIKMRNVQPKTKVRITHYRIVPHYGMNAMSHLNRVKKAISDRIQFILRKS